MRGAPVLAALQAVAVASAEEAVVALAQVVAAVGAVAAVVAGAGKSGLRLFTVRMIALEEKKMGHLTRYLGNLVRNSYHCLVLILIIVFAIGSAERALGAAAIKQKTFSSPEEGVKALIDAARKNDTKGILEILGADAKSIIESGDPVADNEGRQRFVKSYDEANKLVKSGEAEMVLEVGKDEWPFPIPLVKETDGWRFDTQEGK